MRLSVAHPLEVPQFVQQFVLRLVFNAIGWMWFAVAIGFFVAGFMAMRGGAGNSSVTYICIALLTTSQSICFHGIGILLRDMQNSQTEMTNRLAEQEDRIRKLEEQLAALKPSPTR